MQFINTQKHFSKIKKNKTMIPINELRIGNYVNGDKDGISVVTSIERYKDRIGITPLTFNHYSFTNQPFSPIPLTAEILEKCGFIDTIYEWTKGDIVVKWSSRIISSSLRQGLYVEGFDHIQYLHQLQNLYFFMTGEELTFKY